MKVAIHGGSGFIGKALTARFISRGDQVVVSTRRDVTEFPATTDGPIFRKYSPDVAETLAEVISGCDALINVAGEPLFKKRWSSGQKQKIFDSRVENTNGLVSAISKLAATERPKTFLCASAVGYYGTSTRDRFSEDSSPGTEDFLSSLCREWESAANDAGKFGIRIVNLRFGIVLDKDEGALPQMLGATSWLRMAVPLGFGGQWVSWVHVSDAVRMVEYAARNDGISGPLNVTAPNPIRNCDLMKAAASKVGFLYVPLGPPKLLLRIVVGEAAGAITRGQYVVPEKAIDSGFQFEFDSIDKAIADLYKAS
ncbi:MAG: TIGR01777 family oxidoreductase [Planctomycetes bacterium]|nr:TIGR01777 family oxidoreductase [Planctomycetota bacterium]